MHGCVCGPCHSASFTSSLFFFLIFAANFPAQIGDWVCLILLISTVLPPLLQCTLVLKQQHTAFICILSLIQYIYNSILKFNICWTLHREWFCSIQNSSQDRNNAVLQIRCERDSWYQFFGKQPTSFILNNTPYF